MKGEKSRKNLGFFKKLKIRTQKNQKEKEKKEQGRNIFLKITENENEK
jgi:hypothetical protein